LGPDQLHPANETVVNGAKFSNLINWNAVSKMQKFRGRSNGHNLTCWRPLPWPVWPADDHQVQDVSGVRQLTEG